MAETVVAGVCASAFNDNMYIPTLQHRAMEFLVAILDNLPTTPTMHAAVSTAYDATLKRFHGFLVYGTFKVCSCVLWRAW